MTKWRVRKIRNWWAVITPHGNPSTSRKTYAEAITEAQKLARRVVIALPAGEAMEHAGGFRVWSRSHNVRVSNGFEGIAIAPDEIKPLALALLAHHYRNQRRDSGVA